MITEKYSTVSGYRWRHFSSGDIRVLPKRFQQEGQHILTPVGYLDIPCLVVDARAHVINFIARQPSALAMSNARPAPVAQPERTHTAGARTAHMFIAIGLE